MDTVTPLPLRHIITHHRYYVALLTVWSPFSYSKRALGEMRVRVDRCLFHACVYSAMISIHLNKQVPAGPTFKDSAQVCLPRKYL